MEALLALGIAIGAEVRVGRTFELTDVFFIVTFVVSFSATRDGLVGTIRREGVEGGAVDAKLLELIAIVELFLVAAGALRRAVFETLLANSEGLVLIKSAASIDKAARVLGGRGHLVENAVVVTISAFQTRSLIFGAFFTGIITLLADGFIFLLEISS